MFGAFPFSLPLAEFGNFVLRDPQWFWALLLVPAALWLRRRRAVQVLIVPFAATWHRPTQATLSRWPAGLAFAGLVLLVAGLARPQRVEDKREVRTQGYDIMLAIDLSGSMLAEDYERDGRRVNRLIAIKPVIQAFIKKRPNDRIGIVVFSGRAYTLAPLTFDHDWLERQTERLKIGLIEDGTAIGDGLGVALTRLEQAKRESGGRREGAFVVLLTDGANNRGLMTPEQASDIAKARGIPVYTIGAGQSGLAPMPVFDDRGKTLGYRLTTTDLDEDSLREMADKTKGQFFRAYDTGTIESAFAAIDKAQKIEFQAKSYLITSELFPWVAVPGALLVLAAALIVRAPGRGRLRPPAAAPATAP
jgi:Ca-activated chloride channel family protein